jgi:glutamate decarboxylase
LNFSKGSSTIIAQYYNFIRLGFKGYRDIMYNMAENAKYLAYKLVETGKFELLNKNVTFPLVTVKLKDVDFTVFELSDKLREKGWIVPAYTLPENAEDNAVIRMVIKENFGRDLVEIFLKDIIDACNTLEQTEEEKERKNPTLLY